jgi:hypothetical protein
MQARMYEFRHHLGTAVRRAVVDDDNLEIFECLRSHTRQSIAEVVLTVENRYHDADQAAPVRSGRAEIQMQRFRVNVPDVVFEAFDEEIVLVNLESGNYYSVRGSGPEIWMALAQGENLDQIGRNLQARYSGEPSAIQAAVVEFVDRLIAEKLLLIDGDSAAALALAPIAAGDRAAFESPVLESYSDMQDLLLLDPIHDVDQAGWPVANQA